MSNFAWYPKSVEGWSRCSPVRLQQKIHEAQQAVRGRVFHHMRNAQLLLDIPNNVVDLARSRVYEMQQKIHKRKSVQGTRIQYMKNAQLCFASKVCRELTAIVGGRGFHERHNSAKRFAVVGLTT